MRLIDADALFREMEKAQWYNNADRDEIAEKLVLNASTIEPERKKGKWTDLNAFHPNYATCSECGFMEEFAYENNFCPMCGADMRGDDHDL